MAFAVISVSALAILLAFRANLSRFLHRIPFARVRSAVESFAGGLAFLEKGRSFGLAMLYSAVLWVGIALQFWFMMRGMHFEWSPAAGTLVMVVTAIGSLAQIPAIGGGFQAAVYFCMTTFFKVPAERAAAAALIAWVASYAPTIIGTVAYLPFAGISWTELKSAIGRRESVESKTA
jgi:uncharacterized membrane protein YbhN (UPF0104 family)